VIVSRREAARIEGGRKIQHRVPRHRRRVEVGETIPITTRVPNAGLGYVNGEPKLEPTLVCRVRVVAVAEQAVQAASEADAKAEGYRHRRELLEAWDTGSGDRPLPTWVFRFDVIREERPRFLARVVAGRVADYVDNPARGCLPDEPEAVDEATVRRFSLVGRARHRDRERERREIRAKLDFDGQVRALAAEARARHIDVRDELRAIERWNNPEARERQLDRLRRKVESPLVA
jgi:hypothetical protein